MEPEFEHARNALRTPAVPAAIAGIIFGLLLGTALVLLRLAIPSSPTDAGTWLDDSGQKNLAVFALNLIPFAGIAFLWFIGVVRDRIGQAEDRFFSTVFLGSGLLFVAMLFVAAAVAGGLIAAEVHRGSAEVTPEVWRFGRQTTFLVLTVYAMRMAAVFTISTTTIALRLGIFPKWLTILGFGVALVLMLTVGSLPWVELLFPLWVLTVSLVILLRRPLAAAGPGAGAILPQAG